MAKAVVIYFSNTGNTEALANDILAALEKKYETELINVNSASKSDIENADVVVLGCPACGAEELDSDTFEPFYNDIKDLLSSKKVAFFGPYDWGTGEFMETWVADAESAGINVLANLAVQNDDLSSVDVNLLVNAL